MPSRVATTPGAGTLGGDGGGANCDLVGELGQSLVGCLHAYHALDACLPRAEARPSFETLMISILSTTQTQPSQQYRNNNVSLARVVGVVLGPPI